MILKIERHSKDRDWWILDGIRRISMHAQKVIASDDEAQAVFENVDYDLRIIDNVSYGLGMSVDDQPNKPRFSVQVMELRMDNGDIYLLIFDTVAYLLNDQGKTVEKIVVNFPAVKDDGTIR